MKLFKLNDRVYYSEYEDLRDRPTIGYIKGDNYSIAIDAGHSKEHLDEFYDALKENNLPLPMLTVITHWHWDHSFAMHAINGLSIANKRTNEYLLDFINKRSKENDLKFLNLDPSIALEYKDNKEIIVVHADIIYEKELILNPGGIEVKLFEAISPHTDDSTLVLLPKEKILFFGDALSGVFPTWIADDELKRQFRETIESLDVEYCIGGHWNIFTKEELINQVR
ncbi:MAG: MBL fold metallo-hydrolase [Erysipelotrichaceae bacterium]|nr:MBL fold metallo-hydrolase [Erysipelotrichaceae bacterium]